MLRKCSLNKLFVKKFFVTKNELEDKLKAKLKISELAVVDTSGGCGSSFQVKIKSSDFNGKSVIAQHRLVNDILKEELKEIHALQLKTETDSI
jgi:stress-induced morphogen